MDKSDNQSTESLSNNLDKRLLTVKEVANIIDETPHIVRNWLKVLKDYIPLQKDENGYNMFDDAALELIKLIKQLHRDQNYSIKQIEHYFVTGGESYKPVPTKGTDELLAEELRKMREEIQVLREYSEKQEKFNKVLIEKLMKQDEYIQTSLERRDQLLIEKMRSSLEEQKKLAIESANDKGLMVNEQFEKVTEQLEGIKQQQIALKDEQKKNIHFAEMPGQLEALKEELNEMKKAMQEAAVHKEEKKGFFSRLFKK